MIGGSLTRKPAKGHSFLWQNGKMRDLGTLGRYPPTSEAVAINDRGWITGDSPATGGRHPFLWRNGKMIDLGGGADQAVAINERGQVLCGTSVWQNGKRATLPALSPQRSWTTAVAINEQNQVVGSSTTARGRGRAVLWTLEPGS